MKLQFTTTSLAATLGVGLAATNLGGASNHDVAKNANVASSYHHSRSDKDVGDECDPMILPRDSTKSYHYHGRGDSIEDINIDIEPSSSSKPDTGILSGSCVNINSHLTCVADPTSASGGRCQLLRLRASASVVVASTKSLKRSTDARGHGRGRDSTSASSSRKLLTFTSETPEERCIHSALQCLSDPTSGYCHGTPGRGSACDGGVKGRCVVFCNVASCCNSAASTLEKEQCVFGEPYLCGKYNLGCTNGEGEGDDTNTNDAEPPFENCHLRECCNERNSSGSKTFDEKRECMASLYDEPSMYDENDDSECYSKLSSNSDATRPPNTTTKPGPQPLPVSLPLFPEPNSCSTDNPSETCDENEFCLVGLGVCSTSTVGKYGNGYWGTCYYMPDACLGVFDPVCGCDGKTHSNSCVAWSYGVNVYRDGACEKNSVHYVESWPAKEPGKGEETGEETTTTTTTTTTVAPPKDEGEEAVPCLTREDCDIQRQNMGMDFIFTGNFPTKGCFSKNNKAFFSSGTYDEMTSDALPGMQKRISCTKKQACMTQEECNLKRQSMVISSSSGSSNNNLNVGDFPTKGCFAKNDKVFFSAGTREEMETVILPGVQKRLWCDDILKASSVMMDPTGMPTYGPSTGIPTDIPTQKPSAKPSTSIEPTKVPSTSPTESVKPSMSNEPTKVPSSSPSMSNEPTEEPSISPAKSVKPSMSNEPTEVPSASPTESHEPTESTRPTRTGDPSFAPTKYPITDVLDTLPSDQEEEIYSTSEVGIPATGSPSVGPASSPVTKETAESLSGAPSLSLQLSQGPTNSSIDASSISRGTTNSLSIHPSMEPTGYPSDLANTVPKSVAENGTPGSSDLLSSAAVAGTAMVFNVGIAAAVTTILLVLWV